jgi:hypothetical protein
VKEFFGKSKKMFSPPKDLPRLSNNIQANIQQQANEGKNAKEPGNLTIMTQTPLSDSNKVPHFPKLEIPKTQEIIITSPKKKEIPVLSLSEERDSFDEAIKRIHSDLLKSGDNEDQRLRQVGAHEEKEYYKPKVLGEGYFSEIKHYLENNELHDITEEMLAKDLLTSMKDYHDHKSKGKPYYLHRLDLEEKLERKLLELMRKEEEWHEAKKAIEDTLNAQKRLEKDIDEEAKQLKNLFSLIKTSQLLNRQAPEGQEFKLINTHKLKSLNDLRKALAHLKDEEYTHHANEHRNDFADWVLHSLNMQGLSHSIRLVNTRQELEELLKNP